MAVATAVSWSRTQNEEAYASSLRKQTRKVLGRLRRCALGVELHDSDLAVSAELDIGDLEHRGTLDGARSGSGQLHRDILRGGVQDNRRYFERGREFHGRDLEPAGHMD